MPAESTPLRASLVVAATTGLGIGKNGALPWPRLPSDLARFKRLTLGHTVVMGSATYFSLPPSVRPLPGRTNLVLSSRSRDELSLPDGVLIAGGFDAAEAMLRARGGAEGELGKVFVIGGESVFRAALERPEWSARVHLTEVLQEFDADRFFPVDLRNGKHGFQLVSQGADTSDGGVSTRTLEFARAGVFLERPLPAAKRHAEHQYLDLVRRILTTGHVRGDRTGTGTRAVFGAHMRFDLRDSFPLLTTKRVFWRGVVEELLWFIRGSTNAKELSERGVRIWDANGSREFLDQRGFKEREEGDLGPVYGFQWRHFGAKYVDMRADYAGKGVDQLKEVIDKIKNNPTDRRIILSAWNPAAIPEMALPPCHLLAQFFVGDGELSCQMYQRSADMGLGVPFNIASYALLTCLIAKVCGLRPGEFVHALGDAHVYSNHVEALETQLLREPMAFPTLEMRERGDIDEFTVEDIVLKGYECHGKIDMKMAV